MERWGVRERVCALELFIRTGSITETQRGFNNNNNNNNNNIYSTAVGLEPGGRGL